MILTHANTYNTNTFDIEIRIIEFLKTLVSFFKSIAGIIGIFFVFMPLYYILFSPLMIFTYSLLHRRLSKELPLITKDFLQLSETEKQNFLSDLKNANIEFAKKNKATMRAFKENHLYYKHILKRTKKVNNLMTDFEDDLTSKANKGTFNVPALSDKELLELIKHNQKAHQLV